MNFETRIFFNNNRVFQPKSIINKRNRSLIIKLFDIIILIILFGLFFKSKFSKNKSKYLKYFNEKFDSRDLTFNKSINFIKDCLSSNLLEFQFNFLINEPEISVVIPLYNCEKYILRAVKSIQYQNISNIEIILIDDNSTDNTISLVKKMQSKDNRIKLIQNQKNMGILYSRSIGALSSKGKYLFTLDNDDIFLNNDIFDTTIKLGENGNFDIVEFKAISNRILNQDLLNNKIKDAKFSHHETIILFQPELGRFPIPTGNETGKYGLRDIFLWGKCIKTKIYQKALNKLGNNRYSRFMIRYEDILVNYMIFNIAESFIFIQKYGLYHIERIGSAVSIGRHKVRRNTNLLYLLDVIIDFAQNNENNKKLAAYLVIYYLNLKRVKRTLTSNKYNMELINSCIKRILNSKYISEKHKTQIKNIVKRVKYIRPIEIT